MPKDSATSSVIAGIAAGFVVVTTTQPIWLVKTRMQLQTNQGEVLYKNSLHAIQRMYKEEGLRVFYRGMTASYVGISESTFQFVLYERFKSIVQGYTGKGMFEPATRCRKRSRRRRRAASPVHLPKSILFLLTPYLCTVHADPVKT